MPFYEVYTEQVVLMQRHYYVEAATPEEAKRLWADAQPYSEARRSGPEMPRAAIQSMRTRFRSNRPLPETEEVSNTVELNTEHINDR